MRCIIACGPSYNSVYFLVYFSSRLPHYESTFIRHHFNVCFSSKMIIFYLGVTYSQDSQYFSLINMWHSSTEKHLLLQCISKTSPVMLLSYSFVSLNWSGLLWVTSTSCMSQLPYEVAHGCVHHVWDLVIDKGWGCIGSMVQCTYCFSMLIHVLYL